VTSPILQQVSLAGVVWVVVREWVSLGGREPHASLSCFRRDRPLTRSKERRKRGVAVISHEDRHANSLQSGVFPLKEAGSRPIEGRYQNGCTALGYARNFHSSPAVFHGLISLCLQRNGGSRGDEMGVHMSPGSIREKCKECGGSRTQGNIENRSNEIQTVIKGGAPGGHGGDVTRKKTAVTCRRVGGCY